MLHHVHRWDSDVDGTSFTTLLKGLYFNVFTINRACKDIFEGGGGGAGEGGGQGVHKLTGENQKVIWASFQL